MLGFLAFLDVDDTDLHGLATTELVEFLETASETHARLQIVDASLG